MKHLYKHDIAIKLANTAAFLCSVSTAMRFATIAAALLPLAHGFTKEEYDSGAVMAKMMAAKEVLLTL